MKKKFIWIALLCCLLSALLAGCGGTGKKDIYATLNQLAAKTPQTVTLQTSVTAGGETLTGEFEVKTEENGYRVTYSYQKFNTFEEEGGEYQIPGTDVSSVEGNMLVSDGKIIEQNGSASDITVEQITASGVKFAASCFTDVKQAEGSFQAKVSDPSAFLQEEISCTDMTVSVSYGEIISSMKIAYTSAGGAQVELEYTFA